MKRITATFLMEYDRSSALRCQRAGTEHWNKQQVLLHGVENNGRRSVALSLTQYSAALIILLTIKGGIFMKRFSVMTLAVCFLAPATGNSFVQEGSDPIIRHSLTTQNSISFDVELRGLCIQEVVHGGVSYSRFQRGRLIGTLDGTGTPELPYVPCFVAVPDDCDLSVSVSAYCDHSMSEAVVYPVPLDSTVSSAFGLMQQEFFRMDSVAYSSNEWYPSVHAELAGEFRLRDQRIAVVNVYPVQYKASDDSLKVWNDIEVMVHLEGAQLNWTLPGLDSFDRLIGDILIGYTPSTVIAPVSHGNVERHDDMTEAPSFVPDYVIITADGLNGKWIDDLADHRAALNGFNVLIANLEDIFDEYGGSPPWPTAQNIRDYMSSLWELGGTGNRPTYLLLVGDVQQPYDVSPHYEPWYLPAAQWNSDTTSVNYLANDDWFVMFNHDFDVFAAPADMIAGRLSARTAENIEEMIDLIMEYEQDASVRSSDYLDQRRILTRLAGTDHGGSFESDQWEPSVGCTDSLRQWMGYDWDDFYCGDGDASTTGDGSTMSSADWVQACEGVFSRGSQAAFYSDHGHFHYFSAGICYDPGGPVHFGVPDSVFSCSNVESLNEIIPPGHVHLPPFLLMLCCTAGTFNHTEEQHYLEVQDPICSYTGDDFPLLDLGVPSLSESFIRNTRGGAIGVFAGTLSSMINTYGPMGRGILESVYYHGVTRTGDAVTRMRLTSPGIFLGPSGWREEFGQFNLLGDPAVDIGDRILYPNACDLVISPSDLMINRYPTRMPGGGGDVSLYATVRNTGATASGAFPVTLSIDNATSPQVLNAQCAGLLPGEETTVRFTWTDHTWFSSGTLPAPLTLTAVADPQEQSPDCWRPNNSATAVMEVTGFYPNKEGWPVQLPYSTKVPAVLADMTRDNHLEVIVLLTRPDRKGVLQVYDASANLLWESDAFQCGSSSAYHPVPVVGNVYGDHLQIVLDGKDSLHVFDLSTTEPLFSYGYSGQVTREGFSTAVLADLVTEQGQSTRDEVVVVRGDRLMVFDIQQHTKPYELILARSAILPDIVSSKVRFTWPMVEDIQGDATPEILVQVASVIPPETHFFIYDHAEDDFFAEKELASGGAVSWRTIPAVGFFGDDPAIAVSTGKNLWQTQEPVRLLDATDDQLPVLAECESSPVTSNRVLCCMMTDWDPLIPGLDRVIANAENQAIAWDDAGRRIWHSEYDTGTAHPPLPALAVLTRNGLSDVVAGNREGVVSAFDHAGRIHYDLGFPYTLPAEVYGGFVIADIDEDGVLEMVFGTMDNHLHVWELGECEEGYAPWPQAQGNARRTGVLQ